MRDHLPHVITTLLVWPPPWSVSVMNPHVLLVYLGDLLVYLGDLSRLIRQVSEACNGLELLASSLGWSWTVNTLIRERLCPLVRHALHDQRSDKKCEISGGGDCADELTPDLGCHVVGLLGRFMLLAPARDHAYGWLRAQLLAILHTTSSTSPQQLRAAVALLQSLEVPTAAASGASSAVGSRLLVEGTARDDAATGAMSDGVVIEVVSSWARADALRVSALRRLGVISQTAWAALDASMNASMSTCTEPSDG